jgi:hypothetical protein
MATRYAPRPIRGRLQETHSLGVTQPVLVNGVPRRTAEASEPLTSLREPASDRQAGRSSLYLQSPGNTLRPQEHPTPRT